MSYKDTNLEVSGYLFKLQQNSFINLLKYGTISLNRQSFEVQLLFGGSSVEIGARQHTDSMQ